MTSSSLTSLNHLNLASASISSYIRDEAEATEPAKAPRMFPREPSNATAPAPAFTSRTHTAKESQHSSTSQGAMLHPRPFADMIPLADIVWGGKLASMVVCEGCRQVSHTYEDFLHLSLPLRAEDAVSRSALERRQNRIRFISSKR